MTQRHKNWAIWSPQNLFLKNRFPLCKQAGCICNISLSCMQSKWYIGSQKWMMPRGTPWGIQIGAVGARKKYSWKVYFPFINKLHAAFSFSCMQRKGDPKRHLYQGVYYPGTFNLDQLDLMQPIWERSIFTLLTSHMQEFPFFKEKGTLQLIPKVTATRGYMTMGYSNWTSRSSWNQFLKNKFSLY